MTDKLSDKLRAMDKLARKWWADWMKELEEERAKERNLPSLPPEERRSNE